MSEKSQAKLEFEKYIQMEFFKLFPILQMLGFVTSVFGHQESIGPISLTLNANNGWFKVSPPQMPLPLKYM